MKKGIYFFNLLDDCDKEDFIKEYKWCNEEEPNVYFEKEFEDMYDFLIHAFDWGCNEGQWLSIIKINE